MDSATSVQRFRHTFAQCQNLIVIAGAGLSAASGIPTFRDGGGIWQSVDVTTLATPTAFAANPSLVWQFYHYRRVKALEARPNLAHAILAKLLIPNLLNIVAPHAKSFNLITQNVDQLSERALDSLGNDLGASASTLKRYQKSIFAMHGNIFEVQCTDPNCGHAEHDLSNPLCPALSTQISSYEEAGHNAPDIPLADLPRCKKCGALARPGVVWFDEKPRMLDEINLLVYKADLCLVIGTSSTVRPASTYAYRVHRHGGKVAVFNLNPNEGESHADFVFRGPCEVELARIFPELIDADSGSDVVG